MAFFFKSKNSDNKGGESDKVIDELHGVKTAVKVLYTKVAELQASVKELTSSAKTESQSLRGLIQGMSKDMKSSSTTNNLPGKPLSTGSSACEHCNTTKYVLGAAVVVALGYGYMHVKGISVSDVVNGTKYTMASTVSNVTRNLEKKSAQLTDKMRILTERIENYTKKDEKKNMDVPKPTENSKSDAGQEFSDLLFKLVMEEGEGLDEEYLGEVYDYLNENPVAARGFVSKSSNMRKKWIKDFGKKAFEKI
ncbi:hypothetical protein ACHQM5_008205 [Ranunculus cassubicifolius]